MKASNDLIVDKFLVDPKGPLVGGKHLELSMLKGELHSSDEMETREVAVSPGEILLALGLSPERWGIIRAEAQIPLITTTELSGGVERPTFSHQVVFSLVSRKERRR